MTSNDCTTSQASVATRGNALFSDLRLPSASNNLKGRVPRALPVGEYEGADLVCLGHGSYCPGMEFVGRNIT